MLGRLRNRFKGSGFFLLRRLLWLRRWLLFRFRLLRGWLLGRLRKQRQCAEKTNGQSAQASRPGKHHLKRVPFHSAPNFRRPVTTTGFTERTESKQRDDLEVKSLFYRILWSNWPCFRGMVWGRKLSSRFGGNRLLDHIAQAGPEECMRQDVCRMRRIERYQRVDTLPKQRVPKVIPDNAGEHSE